MPENTEHLGEIALLVPPPTFSAVMRRAIDAAGNCATFCRIAGLKDQTVRRWTDQSKLPTIEVLYDTRKRWPVAAWFDLIAWLTSDTRVRPTLLCGGATLAVPASGDLTELAIGIMHLASEFVGVVHAAEKDGRIDANERAELDRRMNELCRRVSDAQNVTHAAVGRRLLAANGRAMR